ncbi:hypothetical protein [uncultured Cellulomonas sp.]|uniref:hypothetical protein n=1 Tax=uncultured Cellulomonas sp. TaxID=189682 RepID=UPI002606FF79|nr:hypothetical protein [uncultured Cellulomonas sp.]
MTAPEVRHLHRVLASLDAHLDGGLDGQLAGLCADPAVAEGRAALTRLVDPDHAARLADELDPREAAWLAEELLRRWAVLAPPVLDPQAGLDRTTGPAGTRLTVRVVGLDPGWTVAWTGAQPDPDEPGTATWTGRSAGVTARVLGRGPAGRVVLAARWDPPGEAP